MTRESLWLDGLEATSFPPLVGERVVDVAVVGGGIAGILAAHQIAARGASVVLVDAGRVGGGVTGGTTGKVSALQQTLTSKITRSRGVDEARRYAEANRAGLALIGDIVDEHSIDCDWEVRDACTFALDDSETETVEQELAATQAIGLPTTWEVEHGLPMPSWGSVRLAGQAQFNAAAFVAGLARSLQADADVEIFESTRVNGLREAGKGVRLATTAGEIRAERAVLATHMPFADRGLYFARLQPQRSYCMAFEIAGDVPEGMYISAGKPTRSIRSAVSPSDPDRRLLIVGGEGHRVGETDPAEHYEELHRWAQQHFEVERATHSWSAQDYMTYDHLPMVGPLHRLSSKSLVITGFNKWGLASAGAAAMEVATRLDGAAGPWQDIFDSQRVSPSEVPELVKGGLKVAQHFALDHLTDRSAPTCTHMGCKLKWNDGEDSWDCPCHGSRFDASGKVIQGPATRDIEGLAD